MMVVVVGVAPHVFPRLVPFTTAPEAHTPRASWDVVADFSNKLSSPCASAAMLFVGLLVADVALSLLAGLVACEFVAAVAGPVTKAHVVGVHGVSWCKVCH